GWPRRGHRSRGSRVASHPRRGAGTSAARGPAIDPSQPLARDDDDRFRAREGGAHESGRLRSAGSAREEPGPRCSPRGGPPRGSMGWPRRRWTKSRRRNVLHPPADRTSALGAALRPARVIEGHEAHARAAGRRGSWYVARVMQFSRRVDPERLDSLPASAPAATQSRRDLQRLNVVMGQSTSIARWLRVHEAPRWMRRVVDLGGGDGTLLLRVARQLAPHGGAVEGVVVDRQTLVSAGTREEFRKLGWGIEAA